jgi:hypothetical protein
MYGAVSRGEPIGLANYQSALDLADSLTSDLRSILNGNGLGKYEGVPTCAQWFSPAAAKTQGSTRGPTSGAGSGDAVAKRQKTLPANPADAERKKSLGILEFDTTVAGTRKVPVPNVFHKKRGAKLPERLCMNFLTKGYSCTNDGCNKPHITNIDTLPGPDKAKLIDFVKKQPGLSWVPGKSPTGTV